MTHAFVSAVGAKRAEKEIAIVAQDVLLTEHQCIVYGIHMRWIALQRIFTKPNPFLQPHITTIDELI
jgi:hypothetical protein